MEKTTPSHMSEWSIKVVKLSVQITNKPVHDSDEKKNHINGNEFLQD